MFVTFSRRQERRFLVIDSVQMILVEPDTKRLGWGVVRFVGFLQVNILISYDLFTKINNFLGLD